MKKKLLALIMALTLALSLTAASADMIDDAMAGYDMTAAQKAEFRALITQIGSPMTATQISDYLKAYVGTLRPAQETGVMEDGRYCISSGLSALVPEGWEVRASEGASDILLVGKAKNGVTPSISILETEGEQPEFETVDKAFWDAQYGAVLPGFEAGMLETSIHQDVTAHLYTCYYDQTGGTRLALYQMYFNRAGKAYVITMTTEDAVSSFMDAFKAFEAVTGTLGFSDTVWKTEGAASFVNG